MSRTDATLSQPSLRATVTASALMLLCAFCVAVMTNFVKIAYGEGSNTETVLLMRALVGVPLLGVILLVTRGAFRIPSHLFRLSFVASLSAALMTYTWYEAKES